MNRRPEQIVLGVLGVLILLLLIGNAAAPSHSHHRAAAHAAPPAGTGTQAIIASPVPSQTVTTPATPSPPPSIPLPPHAEIQRQDRYNYSRRFRAYERRQQITRPAYQHLPYRTSHVRIDIANLTGDGRIILSVTPLSPNVSPQAEYRRFLTRYHDPGSVYLPVYARFGA
jgi:hypothetical protein